jgi:hypothetical protein
MVPLLIELCIFVDHKYTIRYPKKVKIKSKTIIKYYSMSFRIIKHFIRRIVQLVEQKPKIFLIKLSKSDFIFFPSSLVIRNSTLKVNKWDNESSNSIPLYI